MTSNDIKTTQTNTKPNTKNKIFLNVGSKQETIEINDQYLDETLDNEDISMELALQKMSSDERVRNDTI